MSNLKTKKLLVEKDAPILRIKASPVPLEDIGSKKLGDTIASMKRTLHAEDDGVAIAAPQIGQGWRIFVVSSKALAVVGRNVKDKKNKSNDLVFINPEITKSSKKRRRMEEGCLSLRYLYGKVLRSEKVMLQALDEKGKMIKTGASGLLAQIFQHEIDHLNGILFIDKAENIKDVPPTKKDAPGKF